MDNIFKQITKRDLLTLALWILGASIALIACMSLLSWITFGTSPLTIWGS